jgi:hypothetical protein
MGPASLFYDFDQPRFPGCRHCAVGSSYLEAGTYRKFPPASTDCAMDLADLDLRVDHRGHCLPFVLSALQARLFITCDCGTQ